MDEKNFENCLSNKIRTPYFTFVWAEDKNGLIGNDGQLPWHLPNEMKHFVNVTTGGVVIMGRKTYESIPNPPLKNRINIVLTNNKDYTADGAIVCHSKEDILDYVKDIDKPLHIIGGTSLFDMFVDDVNVLYRTVVYEEFEGDTFMPKLNYKYFQVVETMDGIVDEENLYSHEFFIYERKKLVNPFEKN